MVKSVKAIILASVMVSMTMLLVSSCGTSGPTSAQTGSNPQLNNSTGSINSTKSGMLSMPFALTSPPVRVSIYSDASTASSPIILKWDNYPQAASYNLHYSNTPDFASSTIITNITSPYTFKFDNPDKDYFFLLTAVINGEEKIISTDFASLFHSGNRHNITAPFSATYYNLTKTSNASSAVFGLSAYNTTPISIPITGPLEINITYAHPPLAAAWVNLGGTTDGTAVWETSHPTRGIISSGYILWGGGAFTQVNNLGITYINNNPIPGSYTAIASGWDGFEPTYYTHNGTVANYPYDYKTVVPDTIEVTMNGKSVAKVSGPYTWFNRLDFELIPGNNKKKLKSIAITPDNATIYIHHSDPAKREQQYTAMGMYDNNGTITKEDVTKNIGWSSSRPDRATMDTVSIGKAIAATVPGVTDIKAAALLPPPDDIQSNILKLNVKCWDSKYWSQVDMLWRNLPYARYPKIGAPMNWKVGTVYKQSIGALGCNLVCHSMMIRTSGTWSQPDTLNKEMLHPSTTKPKSTYYMVNDVDPDTVKDFSNGAVTEVVETNANGIKPELDNCNFITAQVQSSTGCGHWVFITSQEGDNFTVYDPLRGIVTRTLGDFCGQVWVARTK